MPDTALRVGRFRLRWLVGPICWSVMLCLAGWSFARERSLHWPPSPTNAGLPVRDTTPRLRRLFPPRSSERPWENVFFAAWEAYGHNTAQAQRVLQEVHRLVQQFRNAEAAADRDAAPLAPTPRRAFALCRLLHRKWLRRYRLSATDPHRAWSTGEYNCVSGTLFYCLAASSLGWQVRVRELPEHVQAAVQINGGRWLAVETTLTSGVPPAGKDQQPLRVLSPRQFQAVVFYNRAIDVAERGRAELAIRWNRRAWSLDPANENIRNNLVATVNNHALDLARDGKLTQAERLLKELVALVPDHPVVRQNLRYVAHRKRQANGPSSRPIPRLSPATPRHHAL